jgi:hypothetical protein
MTDRPPAGARVVPRRFAPFVFALLLTCSMTLVISGVVTAINIGVPRDFLWQWLRAWLPTWAIAYPVMLVFRPIAQHLTERLTG